MHSHLLDCSMQEWVLKKLMMLGAGISQAAIGSAAVGMIAEDGSKFGPALIFTALPESIVILGALPLFL